MHDENQVIMDDVQAYLNGEEQASFLRFITCGSVDDGKSTLIGRLLYDSKLIFDDQLAALEADSKKQGTQGDDIDFALLVDGLAAEREQGITIDVAYRFFATKKRRFIVADTPGHEQYTRNMATGASTADLAILLIDARKGVLQQTRRHSFIVSLLGIRHVVLAINKMDLVGYSEEKFDEIEADYRRFSEPLGFSDITCIPVSALKGDNILTPSDNTPWYKGTSLVGHLETVDVSTTIAEDAFRLPVQWVNRPNLDFRGFSGTVASGTIKPGDAIKVLPSAKETSVTRIVTYDGDLVTASAGQLVTLTLADEVDISRGDVIAAADDPTEVSDQFEAKIIWMAEDALLPGRPYLFKTANRTVPGVVTHLKHLINVNTLEHNAAKKLQLNEVGVCNISLDAQIAFDPYSQNRDMGAFIIIDRMTNNTVGAGMIDFALRRASNIHWQALDIDKAERAVMKSQKPAILWFTGFSGSGKSTIANLVEKRLHALGRHTYILDGDNVRHGLNKDLGFKDEDRVENIRRVGEVAKLMVDAGLMVMTSFISPFRAERHMVRNLVDVDEFIEVFVDTSIELCAERDPKGLYKKAKEGKIKNFTGFDSPYEEPHTAEIHLETATYSAEQCAEQIVDYLRANGYLDRI